MDVTEEIFKLILGDDRMGSHFSEYLAQAVYNQDLSVQSGAAMSASTGFVDGRHYTEYVETVNQLKREDRYEDAIALLLRLVDATEEESATERVGVAPWYYEQLAIMYRKQGEREAEVAILQRFAQQEHAPGQKPAKLMLRLEGLIDPR